MKRSEVIDIIDGILIENNLPVLNGVAKEILKALEAAGMQPTGFTARLSTGKKYNPETDYAADTYFIKGWEDE